MKTLKEDDILRVMREEWQARRDELSEQVDMVMNSKVEAGGAKPVISPELKVRHKSSKLRYTVDSVGPRDLILRTPEGEQFLVDKDVLESEYELD
jgi:hypothetical protein